MQRLLECGDMKLTPSLTISATAHQDRINPPRPTNEHLEEPLMTDRDEQSDFENVLGEEPAQQLALKLLIRARDSCIKNRAWSTLC